MKWSSAIVSLALLLLSASPLVTASASNYLVGAGDVLRIAVYDHADLTTTVRVNSDGTILYPLIGTVAVGGQTVTQVAATLGSALTDGFIVNPQVSVFIEEFRSRKAFIMGQVRTPGIYELSGPSTLLELISKAGGLTSGAGETVSIKRKAGPDGAEQTFTASLQSLDKEGPSSLDVPIFDGDSVFVTESGTLYVTGQVNRPNAYKLDKETSVIKAITMAGGFTPLAAQRRVKIIRRINGSETVMDNVPLHAQVLPEDVIVVPESLF